MAKSKDYSKYQVKDLLADERFQNWILHPEIDPASTKFWEALSEKQTALAANITIARDLISGIRFKEEFPGEDTVKDALHRNLIQISRLESECGGTQSKIIHVNPKRNSALRSAIMAAMIAGLLFGGYLVFTYLQAKATITVKTAYGQTKNVILPDSSLVILNAHSTITYPKHWRKGAIRNLTLQGEAYFNIKHLNQDSGNVQPGERFIVHSGQVDVEVLGTRFDIKQKEGASDIVLEKGSIQVTLKKTKRRLLMRPGDRLVYNAVNGQIKKTKVDATDYIGWTRHELILKGENLYQISQMISAYYGVQIQLKGSDPGQTKMEGTILLDSLPDVLFALSTAMDLDIERHGDTLIFQKKRIAGH